MIFHAILTFAGHKSQKNQNSQLQLRPGLEILLSWLVTKSYGNTVHWTLHGVSDQEVRFLEKKEK